MENDSTDEKQLPARQIGRDTYLHTCLPATGLPPLDTASRNAGVCHLEIDPYMSTLVLCSTAQTRTTWSVHGGMRMSHCASSTHNRTVYRNVSKGYLTVKTENFAEEGRPGSLRSLPYFI